MMRFATLGPDDSNHALILRRYLAERGLEHASITLVNDFPSAFESLVARRLDYVLQVTAHPLTPTAWAATCTVPFRSTASSPPVDRWPSWHAGIAPTRVCWHYSLRLDTTPTSPTGRNSARCRPSWPWPRRFSTARWMPVSWPRKWSSSMPTDCA
nr:hypothetical protein [Halomonas elongata]